MAALIHCRIADFVYDRRDCVLVMVDLQYHRIWVAKRGLYLLSICLDYLYVDIIDTDHTAVRIVGCDRVYFAAAKSCSLSCTRDFSHVVDCIALCSDIDG